MRKKNEFPLQHESLQYKDVQKDGKTQILMHSEDISEQCAWLTLLQRRCSPNEGDQCKALLSVTESDDDSHLIAHREKCNSQVMYFIPLHILYFKILYTCLLLVFFLKFDINKIQVFNKIIYKKTQILTLKFELPEKNEQKNNKM